MIVVLNDRSPSHLSTARIAAAVILGDMFQRDSERIVAHSEVMVVPDQPFHVCQKAVEIRSHNSFCRGWQTGLKLHAKITWFRAGNLLLSRRYICPRLQQEHARLHQGTELRFERQ